MRVRSGDPSSPRKNCAVDGNARKWSYRAAVKASSCATISGAVPRISATSASSMPTNAICSFTNRSMSAPGWTRSTGLMEVEHSAIPRTRHARVAGQPSRHDPGRCARVTNRRVSLTAVVCLATVAADRSLESPCAPTEVWPAASELAGHAGVCHYVEFVGEYAPYERSEESRKLDTRGCRG